jgi:RNA polymerase sigma-70 factor (sigma-E family)
VDADVAATLDAYVRSRGDRLVRTAYLLTGDRQIAEDLVQNALASVVVSWRRIRDVSNFDAYVYTALVNARTRWWSERRTVATPTEHLPERSGIDEHGRFDGRADMVAALRTLPPRQRAVLVLRFYEDLTEAQTALILGCSAP